MIYPRMCEAVFVSRPNRFIANIEIEGRAEVCHVKNTGRCAELLIPGAGIWVQHNDLPTRRTKYDLITVDRGGVLINMDSQAPNKLFAEWALDGGIKDLEELRAEQRYKNSRFDFMLRQKGNTGYAEIKGVTLERGGQALFPDAPTERGVRHIRELIEAKNQGFDASIFFVVQMKGPRVLRPNAETQPEFGRALAEARDAGVGIYAYDCLITPDSAKISERMDIDLE